MEKLVVLLFVTLFGCQVSEVPPVAPVPCDRCEPPGQCGPHNWCSLPCETSADCNTRDTRQTCSVGHCVPTCSSENPCPPEFGVCMEFHGSFFGTGAVCANLPAPPTPSDDGSEGAAGPGPGEG